MSVSITTSDYGHIEAKHCSGGILWQCEIPDHDGHDAEDIEISIYSGYLYRFDLE